MFYYFLLSFNLIKIIFCLLEVEKISIFWWDVVLIVGVIIVGIVVVVIIVGLVVVVKKGKFFGMKLSGFKKWCLLVLSLSSSSSSSDESDKEFSNKRKCLKIVFRFKIKVRFLLVKFVKVEIFLKVFIKG